MKSFACESCALNCGLVQVQEALPGIIASAEERRAMNDLGMEIANQTFASTKQDVDLEKEMAELTGVTDDSVTAAAKASERYDVFEAVLSSLQAGIARTGDNLDVISRGPVDLQAAGDLQKCLRMGCAGPRRGLRLPLTNIVMSLPGGRGKEYCTSSSRNVIAKFLGRMSTTYPGILDTPPSSQSPDA